MRKLSLLVVLFLIINYGFGQTRNKPFALYSTIGIKTGFGFNSIYNGNMEGDENLKIEGGHILSNGIKTSLNYVGKRPINTIIGIQFEYLFDNLKLKIPVVENNLGAYEKNITYKTNVLAIIGRYTNVNRKFMLESGVQFSRFRAISVENIGIHPNHAYYTNGFNYRSNYKNYTSLVFGAGVYTKYVNVSLKQTIAVNSITIKNANPVKDGFYNHPEVNPTYGQSYSKNNPTKQYSIQLTLEYYLPFIKFKRYWRGKTEFSAFQKIDPVYYWGKSLD